MVTLIVCALSFLAGCCFGVVITAVLCGTHNWDDDDEK